MIILELTRQDTNSTPVLVNISNCKTIHPLENGGSGVDFGDDFHIQVKETILEIQILTGNVSKKRMIV